RPAIAAAGPLSASALEGLRRVSAPLYASSPLWAIQGALTRGYLASLPLITSYNIRSDSLAALASTRTAQLNAVFQMLGSTNLLPPALATNILSELNRFFSTWGTTLTILLNHN